MSFNFDNTIFYAIKNNRDNYTIRAAVKSDFYAKENWNNEEQEAYLVR